MYVTYASFVFLVVYKEYIAKKDKAIVINKKKNIPMFWYIILYKNTEIVDIKNMPLVSVYWSLQTI